MRADEAKESSGLPRSAKLGIEDNVRGTTEAGKYEGKASPSGICPIQTWTDLSERMQVGPGRRCRSSLKLLQRAAEPHGAVRPRSMPCRPPFDALTGRESLPKPTVILWRKLLS